MINDCVLCTIRCWLAYKRNRLKFWLCRKTGQHGKRICEQHNYFTDGRSLKWCKKCGFVV